MPCNPDCLAMAYALKQGGELVPLTRHVEPRVLIKGTRNSIAVERDPALRELVFKLFSTANSPDASAQHLASLLCCLPQVETLPDLGYRDVFRIIIMQFLDAHSFDLRAVKKSCVQIAQPNGELIPFDTYNLFYRDDRRDLLQSLRERHDRAWAQPRAEETSR